MADECDRRTLRVLVADDDPAILGAIRAKLEDDGIEVATAPNGREALRVLSEDGPFDAAVIDMRMPELDGAGVVGAMRPDMRGRTVVMSGDPWSAANILGQMEGAFGVSACAAKPTGITGIARLARAAANN